MSFGDELNRLANEHTDPLIIEDIKRYMISIVKLTGSTIVKLTGSTIVKVDHIEQHLGLALSDGQWSRIADSLGLEMVVVQHGYGTTRKIYPKRGA